MPTTLPAYSTLNTLAFAAGSHTRLACELNNAMAHNWGARHLYLVTYGVAWQPLPTPGIIPDAPLTQSSPTVAGIAPVSNTEATAWLESLLTVAR